MSNNISLCIFPYICIMLYRLLDFAKTKFCKWQHGFLKHFKIKTAIYPVQLETFKSRSPWYKKLTNSYFKILKCLNEAFVSKLYVFSFDWNSNFDLDSRNSFFEYFKWRNFCGQKLSRMTKFQILHGHKLSRSVYFKKICGHKLVITFKDI